MTDVQRRPSADGTAALLLSLRLIATTAARATSSVPLRFDIDGARSELAVDMEGPALELKNHRIPLAAGRARGWGRVSIPADANPADDEFYFVFDEPPPRHTILVTEERGRGPAARSWPPAARPIRPWQAKSKFSIPDQLEPAGLGTSRARALASAAAGGRHGGGDSSVRRPRRTGRVLSAAARQAMPPSSA